MDLIKPELTLHSQRVAYISFSIGRLLGLPWEKIYELVLSGLLHDLGVISYKDTKFLKDFESDIENGNSYKHAFITYYLLKDSTYLENIARYIKFHRVNWNFGKGREFNREEVPIESHILHLADRIEVLINDDENILSQRGRILKKIKENSNKMFVPYLVEAFYELAEKEYFWFDLSSKNLPNIITKKTMKEDKKLNIRDFEELSEILARLIDFKSPFTSIHSKTVSKISEVIGNYLNYPQEKLTHLRIAGLLHDIGKISIPSEILEKKAPLNNEEWYIIRSHPYNTHKILDNIKGLENIRDWASFHHERYDGSGYPFHLRDDEIPEEAQVIAIADILTALSEDRPYRKALSPKEILLITEEHIKGGVNEYLFRRLMEIIKEVTLEINKHLLSSKEEYEKFRSYLRSLDN